MKKIIKQLSVLTLAGLLTTSAIGCNTGNTPQAGDQKLNVYICNQGYRTAGVEALLDSFAKQDWVKNKYPNLEIMTPTINNQTDYAVTKIKAPKTNDFDILFTPGTQIITLYEKNAKGEYLLEDLTESVYKQEVLDRPGVTFEQAMDSVVRETGYAYTAKGASTVQYFGVPWVTGASGIIYSEEILARYGYTDGKTPNTTDELLQLCEDIKNRPEDSGNSSGFSFINASGYYSALPHEWWAQYDGVEAYKNFWEGKYTDSRGTSYSNKIFDLKGRLKALEVIDESVKYENGYYDLENQNAGDFMTRQATLLKGQYAMMVCADWYDTEMALSKEVLEAEGVDTHTIKLMPKPVISALIEKLDTVNDDATLSKVVAAIDAGETSYDGVSDKDFKRVQEARGVYQTGGTSHEVVVPAKANDKDIAIDFLKFMATKTAQEAYMIATMGQNLPFAYDYQNMSDDVKAAISPLQESRLNKYYNNSYPIQVLPSTRFFPLVRYGGLTAVEVQSTNYNTIFAVPGNTITPQKIFDDTKTKWTEAVFNFALLQAGLD